MGDFMIKGQADRVTEHAKAVASGREIAGELHRLACERHLRDLKRQNTKDFPYYYDLAAANDIIEFAFKHGINIVSSSRDVLTDVGSIIPVIQ